MAVLQRVVLLSPDFGPRDPLAKWPWVNRLLPRLMPEIVLEDESPANEEVAWLGAGWFPSAAVFPMQAPMAHLSGLPLDEYRAPTLAVYHHGNPVVDTEAIRGWLDRLEANGIAVEREVVTPVEGGHPRVLAGRLLAPTQVRPVTRRIVDFVQRPAP